VLHKLSVAEKLHLLLLDKKVLVDLCPPEEPDVAIVSDGPLREASRVQLSTLGFCFPRSHQPGQTKHLQHLLALLVHVVGDGAGQPVGLGPLSHQGVLLSSKSGLESVQLSLRQLLRLIHNAVGYVRRNINMIYIIIFVNINNC
jgi:hypothetical protein